MRAPLEIEEASKGLADVIEGLEAEATGSFLDYTGAEVPW